MTKIKKNDVRMRPKWWFQIIKDGQVLLLVLVFVISSLFISSLIYFIGLINPSSLIKMGSIGREVLFEYLPYHLIVAALVTVFFSIFIYPKIGDNYKKERRQIYFFVLLLILIFSAILTGLELMFEKGYFLF